MFRQRRFDNQLSTASRHPYDGQQASAKHHMFGGAELEKSTQFSPQKAIPETAFRLDGGSSPFEDQRDLVPNHRVKMSRPQSLRYSNPHNQQQQQQQQMMFTSNPFFPIFGSMEASQRSHTRHRSRIVPVPKSKSFDVVIMLILLGIELYQHL